MSRRVTQTPAYQRIRNELVAEIENGRLSGGARLPGETQLASRFGVTRMTVRQALAAMVNDGLLVRRQGVGTFIAENARLRNMSRLTGFSEDLANDGQDLRTEVLTQQIVPASAAASALGVAHDEHVIHVGRLRIASDGTPLAVQHSWLPFSVCPELWHEPLLRGSLYATLRERYGIELRRAEQRFAAEAADEEKARLLDIPAGTPLLSVQRITVDERNVPVEYARSWMRPGFEIATYIER